MLCKKCVLEILFQFYILIWISGIHTFKTWIFLRKKFNIIHVIKKSRLKNIISILHISLDINGHL